MHIKHIHNYITLLVISTLILSFSIAFVKNNKHPHNTQTPNSTGNYDDSCGEDSCCDACPICWFKLPKEHCELPCGHKFCKNCIDGWAQRCGYGNLRCPYCRQKFVWKN